MSRLTLMHTPSHSDEVWQSVAFSLMLAMTLTWAVSAMGFLVGASIGHFDGVCGALLAGLLLLQANRGARARSLGFSCVIGLPAVCLVVSAFSVDISYDGWAYHQPGVIALSHGWNPVTQPVFGTWWAHYNPSIGYPAGGPSIDALSTTAYPKALWILGAQAVVWGLPLDCAKYPALLLMCVAGLTALRALRMQRIPDPWAYPLSVITALNPVCVVQSTTFYVDGSLGSCLAILMFSLLSYEATRSGRDLVLALCAALLTCNLKFTGPLYTAGILLPFAAWWLFKRRVVARELLMCGIAAAVLLAGSINPYFTNLRDYGSPVYPLNKWDVMENQMSTQFLQASSIKKLLISLTFSNIADHFFDDPATDERNFTSPLQSRSLGEFSKFGATADLRIGGFGPFFGITVAISLLAAARMAWGRSNGAAFAAIALGTLLSVVVNPQMWWARFVPQLWTLAVVIAAAASRSNIPRALPLSIVLLMAGTSLIAVVERTISSCDTTVSYRDELRKLGEGPLQIDASVTEFSFLPALAYRLHQQGATFAMGTDHCVAAVDLLVIQGCRN